MTTYRGTISEGGDTASSHTVTVDHEDGVGERMLKHRVRHSPSGFSWGYRGSGPADLARSILWEYLGEEPHPACSQAFKERFVATWPQGSGWDIRGEVIGAWLAEWLAERPGREATVPHFDDLDIAEPEPTTVGEASGTAKCQHCGGRIVRSGGEWEWLHNSTGDPYCD